MLLTFPLFLHLHGDMLKVNSRWILKAKQKRSVNRSGSLDVSSWFLSLNIMQSVVVC